MVRIILRVLKNNQWLIDYNDIPKVQWNLLIKLISCNILSTESIAINLILTLMY